jgi:hypothetical protein
MDKQKVAEHVYEASGQRADMECPVTLWQVIFKLVSSRLLRLAHRSISSRLIEEM